MKEASTARLDPSVLPSHGDPGQETVEKLTLQKLERHLWATADFLRGKIDSSDYKHYILGLLFYKSICDVWRDESEARLVQAGKDQDADPPAHRFHIPSSANWADVRCHRKNIGRVLNDAFRQIEEANPCLQGIFQNADFDHPERFPDRTLEHLLDHYDNIPLGRKGHDRDLLGKAYEVLIAHFADDAGKKGGEFYTPKPVGQLLVEALEPREGMSLYDPTCGSGGLLLEAVHYLRKFGRDPALLKLYGQEMNLNTWAICKINLFIHDIDDAFIAHGDTLRQPHHLQGGELMTFDRVLANPPFSLRNWGHEEWKKGDRYGRDRYACPPRMFGDFAFVQHMLESLKPSGRLAVILPHGVLFRGGTENRIRRGLLRDDLIEAVIALPPGLFYGTSISACALFIRRDKPTRRQHQVLFIDGSREVELSYGRSTMSTAHVAHLVQTFRAFREEPGFSKIVPLDLIAAQGYDLSIGRYIHRETHDEILDIDHELAIYRDLCERRNQTEVQLLEMLSTLQNGS